jgi:hypothetical protein
MMLLLLMVPTICGTSFTLRTANADSTPSSIELKNSDYTFVDQNGMTNIVGIVDNHGVAPMSVTMALDVVSANGTASTLKEGLYGSVIYPGGGAPFKFKLSEGVHSVGKPRVYDIKQIDQPFYKFLLLNYTNMAVGEGRVLTGTMKNIGNVELRNVSVYASVHDEKMTDLDSVKSNVVPVLKPGQEAMFTASPDPSVKAKVYYYSCAGFDINAPISTISTGDGKFIPYDFTSVAKVSDMRFENSTNSIAFGITHYNPKGGPASMKIPQLSANQTVTVLMDEKPYDQAQVKEDGKTVYIDFFVPPGEHNVRIQGVEAVPEFPVAILGLAGVFSFAIAIARIKGAFKTS